MNVSTRYLKSRSHWQMKKGYFTILSNFGKGITWYVFPTSSQHLVSNNRNVRNDFDCLSAMWLQLLGSAWRINASIHRSNTRNKSEMSPFVFLHWTRYYSYLYTNDAFHRRYCQRKYSLRSSDTTPLTVYRCLSLRCSFNLTSLSVICGRIKIYLYLTFDPSSRLASLGNVKRVVNTALHPTQSTFCW